MPRLLVVALLLGAPGLALACGGKAHADGAHTSVDPTHCAKQASLVGSNCSYSTGMMAQRVLEQGAPFTFTGTLSAGPNDLKSRVAAPYVLGPEAAVHLVANEVVESLVASGAGAARVTLSGRLLEVDGIQYFVATAFERSTS